jgi:N-acetylmuramoyl-L-alanine amidase
MSGRMRTPRYRAFSILQLQPRRARTCLCGFAILLAFGSAALAHAQADGAQRFVVVIDAAHGGDDGGARLDNEPEKAYTLSLSVKLRSLLMARGIAVVTTRESDATVSPDQRAEIANHAGAQACLSLHASQTGSGVHLFVSSMAPVQPATFLPWKTAQAAWLSRSVSLAGVVNSALTQAGVPVTLGRTALPAIDSMTCPAVAIEVAPRSSSGDTKAAGLDDPDYQARVAEALAAALVEWRSSDRGGRQP